MTDDFIYSRNQSDFIDSVLETVKQYDGDLLHELLNVTRMYQIDDLDFSDFQEPNLDQQLINDNEFLWKLLTQHHWAVCYYLKSNDVDRAFRHQSRKFSCFMSILQGYSTRLAALTSNDDNHDIDQFHQASNDDEPSWLLPTFNRLAHELRLLALIGNDETNNDDYETSDNSNFNSTIQTCNSQFLQASTIIQRFPQNIRLKKVGGFIIVNQTLKTYYALHKFNLCTYSITKGKTNLFNSSIILD